MTPQTTPELKPCPFCGSEASADGHTRFSKNHEAWWPDGSRILESFHVNCIRCGASIQGLGIGQQSREKAIAAWNTRPSGMREALEEARRYIEGCWIDPVADEETQALLAKIDAALISS